MYGCNKNRKPNIQLEKQKFDLDEVVTTVIDGYRNQIQNSNSNEKT
jgi:hypothetical protein